MPQWQLESHLLSIRTPRDSLLAISEKPQQLPLAQSEVIETQRVLLSIPQRHFQPLRLMGAAAQRAVLRWDKPSRASSVELLKERERKKTLLLWKRPIHPLITRLSCCSETSTTARLCGKRQTVEWHLHIDLLLGRLSSPGLSNTAARGYLVTGLRSALFRSADKQSCECLVRHKRWVSLGGQKHSWCICLSGHI